MFNSWSTSRSSSEPSGLTGLTGLASPDAFGSGASSPASSLDSEPRQWPGSAKRHAARLEEMLSRSGIVPGRAVEVDAMIENRTIVPISPVRLACLFWRS